MYVQMDEGREHEAIMREGVGKSNAVTKHFFPLIEKTHYLQTTAATATA